MEAGMDVEELEIKEVDEDDFCLEEELEQHSSIASSGVVRDRGHARSSDSRGGGDGRRAGAGTGGDERGIIEIEALRVRQLMFGDSSLTFNEAWREQGFYFCTGVDGLGYGLVQAEGGPCGVLAAVQAFVLDVGNATYITRKKHRSVNI